MLLIYMLKGRQKAYIGIYERHLCPLRFLPSFPLLHPSSSISMVPEKFLARYSPLLTLLMSNQREPPFLHRWREHQQVQSNDSLQRRLPHGAAMQLMADNVAVRRECNATVASTGTGVKGKDPEVSAYNSKRQGGREKLQWLQCWRVEQSFKAPLERSHQAGLNHMAESHQAGLNLMAESHQAGRSPGFCVHKVLPACRTIFP